MTGKNTMSFLYITPEDLGKGTNIKVEIVDTIEDTYHDFARVFTDEIKRNNKAKKRTVAILPVGPTEPYPKIVRLINLEKINCENVVIINMDEFCTNDGKDYIPYESGLSFRKFMDEEFYSKIDPELNVKKENRIFPDPKNPEATAKKIEQVGDIDICLGSQGLTGHMAFNDPPAPGEDISKEEFKSLSVRVINLACESIVQNALKYGGSMDIVPKKAVTIGMKEILSAKKLYMYFMRDWHPAIVRKAIHGPVTPKFPGSFIQEHPDVKAIISKNAAKLPIDKIPYLM